MNYKKTLFDGIAVAAIVGVFAVTNVHAHDDHDHGDEKSSQFTVWTERFEIFVEHEFILVNKPVKFVTHVSDLATHELREKGSVTFILSQDSRKEIKHIEPSPRRKGVYVPELTFPHPGQWNVSVLIPLDEGKNYTVELPAFKVYESQAEIDHAPPPKKITGITFLKRQQWRIPIKIEPVQQRIIQGQETLSIPESSLVDEDGKSVVFVQIAGETFEKRYPKLGSRDKGFVKVLSGLVKGERVVTGGASAVARAER